MPSVIEQAVRDGRRRIDAYEAPARAQMVDLYRETIARLERDLGAVTDLIATADAAGIEPGKSWLMRQDRYRTLIRQAEAEFDRFASDAFRVIDGVQVQAVRGGAVEAVNLTRAAGVTFGANLNTGAVMNAQAALTSFDSPVRRILEGYGDDAAKTITTELTTGMARGLGPREIVRNITRQLTGPYPAARLEALTRTETMRAFRAGQNAQYASMSHLISGYRWVAAKSVRTCLACLGMDGRVQKEPWDTFHVCCRCISSPIAKGSTYRYQTGEEWLRAQSPDRAQRMFPSRAAYDAWRANTVSLEDFVGRTQSRTWGTSVVQRSGRDVLKGVKPMRRVFTPAGTIADAEAFARSLGVETVKYGNRLDIANFSNRALQELSERGGFIPKSISAYKFRASGELHAFAHYDHTKRRVGINTGSNIWDDATAILKRYYDDGWFSASSIESVIYHEAGHAAHHATAAHRFSPSFQIGYRPEERPIAQTVSRYAATDPLELIAEVYAGHMEGRSFSDEVMALYHKFEGPELP